MPGAELCRLGSWSPSLSRQVQRWMIHTGWSIGRLLCNGLDLGPVWAQDFWNEIVTVYGIAPRTLG